MKRILAALALFAFTPAVVFAVPYTTVGGYGSGVLDSSGAAYVNTDSLRATYSYTATDITPVATATDVVTLTGSATKVIRISQVCVGGSATAASSYDVYLYKRTTADTGGTSTNPTAVQYDSNDAASSSTVTLYTANPATLGTTASAVRGQHLVLINGGTPASQAFSTCWNFGLGEEKPTLRGATQQFAINHGGGAVPAGASVYYTIEWTEE